MRNRCPRLGRTGWGRRSCAAPVWGTPRRERIWAPMKPRHRDEAMTLADAYLRHPAVQSKVRW